MRYAVDTDTLRDGAEAVDRALQRLEKLGIAQVMGSVAAGLPGGQVAGAMGRLGSAWDARASDTRWMLRTLGGRLVAAAEWYDAVEREVARAVGHRAVSHPAVSHPAVSDQAHVGGR